MQEPERSNCIGEVPGSEEQSRKQGESRKIDGKPLPGECRESAQQTVNTHRRAGHGIRYIFVCRALASANICIL